MTQCLVFDLGAGSGRAMVARLDGGRLALTEVHRFSGYAAERADGPHWNTALLFAEIEVGLRKAELAFGPMDSIGVDSWGLDYGLYDAAGRLIGEPFHYRHPRSQQGGDLALPPEARFAATGAQELAVDTLHQLAAEARHTSERHAGVTRLLMMADVVNHHLTGAFCSELTLARTSGLIDARTNRWNADLCERLGLPHRLLQPIIRAGGKYGVLRADLAEPLGWDPVPVIAVAAHDTASAIAALGLDDGSGFLICGSWSLIGAEQAAIDTRPAVLEAGFGNEGGIDGNSFLVRSLNGLHLVQKLRESWQRRTGQDVDFATISTLAAAAPDTLAIDPSQSVLFNPPDMVDAIRTSLALQGADVPDDLGRLTLAIYKGLAAEIGSAVCSLEVLQQRSLPALKLCGGGAQDELLCRLVADATKKPLRIGPIEASAWGNALMQLIGLGVVKSLEDGRRLVERSAEFRDLVRTT